MEGVEAVHSRVLVLFVSGTQVPSQVPIIKGERGHCGWEKGDVFADQTPYVELLP